MRDLWYDVQGVVNGSSLAKAEGCAVKYSFKKFCGNADLGELADRQTFVEEMPTRRQTFCERADTTAKLASIT